MRCRQGIRVGRMQKDSGGIAKGMKKYVVLCG